MEVAALAREVTLFEEQERKLISGIEYHKKQATILEAKLI